MQSAVPLAGMVLGHLPWDKREEKRRWTEVDDAGFYRYIEAFYGITGREKLDNALLLGDQVLCH